MGELIATIDESEYTQRLDQARANLGLAEARLERSRINLKLAERELERVQSMADEGLTSDQQLDQVTSQRDGARADVQLAEADVTRARAAYDEARINFENTKILARLSGSVDKREVDAGTLVSPTTPLCTIVRTDPAKVVVNVPERDIGLLEIGGQAVVTAAAGMVEVAGVVERISPTVDPATRTMLAEIVVPNASRALRPGMYADVTLLIEEKTDVVLVSEKALVRRDEATEVFRVDEGVAHATPVEVGIVADGVAEVRDGLTAGDMVVVRGQYLLNDGDPVRYDVRPGEDRP
jgi:RND family efflux transporter MFP subunit